MVRVLTAIALTLAAVAFAAPSAAASSSVFSDPTGDPFDQPRGVSTASVDIVRGTHGHSGGRLVHTVSVAGGTIANPASSENAPMLYLQPSSVANGTSECAYFVGRHRGRIGIFRCGYGNRVGSATVRRTSARTVRFEFSARAIGNPRSYEWAAITSSASTRYAAGVWYVDRLPSGPDEHFTHALR